MENPLEAMDYIFLLLIGIGMPGYAYIEHLREQARKARGEKTDLMEAYAFTHVFLWVPTILLLGWWTFDGRAFELIGLNLPTAGRGQIAMAGMVVASIALVWNVWKIRTDQKSADKVAKTLEDQPLIMDILPKTPAEYRRFKWVSLSAGITEEILYRGFLIWVLSAWLPVWAAALVALTVFVLGHLYQGTAFALSRVAGAGAVFTVLYLTTGSLVPAMLMHIVIDLASGAACWHAQRAGSRA